MKKLEEIETLDFSSAAAAEDILIFNSNKEKEEENFQKFFKKNELNIDDFEKFQKEIKNI